jgi:hypothetical protein
VAVCGLAAALPVALAATAGTPYATLAPLIWTVVFLWTTSFMLFPDRRGRITNLASMNGVRPVAPTARWRNRIDPRSVDRARFMERQVKRVFRFAAGLTVSAGVAIVHGVTGLFS